MPEFADSIPDEPFNPEDYGITFGDTEDTDYDDPEDVDLAGDAALTEEDYANDLDESDDDNTTPAEHNPLEHLESASHPEADAAEMQPLTPETRQKLDDTLREVCESGRYVPPYATKASPYHLIGRYCNVLCTADGRDHINVEYTPEQDRLLDNDPTFGRVIIAHDFTPCEPHQTTFYLLKATPDGSYDVEVQTTLENPNDRINVNIWEHADGTATRMAMIDGEYREVDDRTGADITARSMERLAEVVQSAQAARALGLTFFGEAAGQRLIETLSTAVPQS